MYRAGMNDERRRFQLEICIDSVASARAARAGGADRVELCAGLSLGGVTPSAGMMGAVREAFDGELHVLIRSREGDFCYDADEVAIQLHDIAQARRLGADGVALGALAPDGTIDTETSRRLIDAAGPMAVTFHRAFDVAHDAREALEAVIALGANRLLTSGQAPTALQGADTIASLVQQAAGRIIIMPASGVSEKNAAELLHRTGCHELHLSARTPVQGSMTHRPTSPPMSGPPPESEYTRLLADATRIRTIRNIMTSA